MFSVGLNSRIQEIPSRTDRLESRALALEALVAPLETACDWLGKCSSYNGIYVSVYSCFNFYMLIPVKYIQIVF